MGPAFDDAALLEHDDLVAVADRAQPVGDDQAGTAPAAEVEVDRQLGLRVERARRLVEHEHRRLQRQRAGDLHPLALPAAEVPSVLGDGTGQRTGALHDHPLDVGVIDRLFEDARIDRVVPQRQVLA